MKIQYAIFDLDGTLIDSVPDLADATNHALGKYGFPTKTEDEVRAAVGHGVYDLLEKTSGAEDARIRDQLLPAFQEYYNQNFCNRSTLYPGILTLLKQLKQQGIRLAVYSNKPSNYVDLIVEQVFESDTFDLVLGQRAEYPTKPDATQLLFHLDQRQVLSQNCCYIGDSDVDIQTAQHANMPVIAVLWGYRSKEELCKVGAIQFVTTAKELGERLLAIEN